MSNGVTEETLDIFARRILAKTELLQYQELFQENYDPSTSAPLGTKGPFRLYIINDGATVEGDPGSAVKCVTLCKRILEGVNNTIICTQKSKVTIDYELVLIVEYENGNFDVMTIPENLSAPGLFSSSTTKAFVDITVINGSGIPVVQHQNTEQPYETLTIKYTTVNDYDYFEYTVSVPVSSFTGTLRPCELEDPTLQSYVLLRNLDYEMDILEQEEVTTDGTSYIMTTVVEIALYEDIIDKLGIDQDIQIVGTPEYVCEDS